MLGQAPRPPTAAMLTRWPELLEYKSISLAPDGWLWRELDWKLTLFALVLDDGVRTVVMEEYPAWWPIWPLKKTETISMSEAPGPAVMA